MTTGVAMRISRAISLRSPGRPVVDKTGLTGVYDLDLTWTPEQGPPGPDGTAPQAAPSSDSVSLFTAVQEQLGLKLDAQRGPVDVLVIESAERPLRTESQGPAMLQDIRFAARVLVKGAG